MVNIKNNNMLAAVNQPAGNYVSYKIIENTLYISGQTTRVDGEVKFKGKIGKELSYDQGCQAAKICAENVLAQVNKACNNNLSLIKSTIKLSVYLQTTEYFEHHAEIANAASLVLIDILGKRGEHTRTAIGVSSLPRNSAVEVDAIFELKNECA